MKHHILGAAGLLALAACGGSEGDGQGNGAAGAKSGQADASEMAGTLQPGQYEVTTQFVGIDAPNMPPAVVEAMKGQTEKKSSCITEKDLKETKSGMFADTQDKECSENTVKFADGRMTGSLKCGSGEEASTMTIDGSYTATSYQADMKMTAGGGTTQIKMSAKRVGECPAGEAEEG
jgi:hypothetical protein